MHDDAHRGIRVRATERGLPVELALDPRVLGRAPEELARDIVLLCRRAAQRSQVARRHDLIARGVGLRIIDGLFLGTESDLAATEAELRGVEDEDDE